MNEIVSVDWLEQHLNDDDLIILDASLPSTIGGTKSAHQDLTIKGARFFDLKNNFTNKNSNFPNTIPTPQQFEIECRKLGINNSSKIIIFDNLGIYSSPRAWWLLKLMGHPNVHVLNGGLPEWMANDYPTVKRVDKNYELGNFKSDFNKSKVKSYEEVLENVKSKIFTIVDARSEGRFLGIENEPRKHLKSGSIPESISVPYKSVLENGKFKSEAELKSILKEVSSNSKEIAFSCGSGMTACIVMLASEMVFKTGQNIYDGSWTEWAEKQNLKVEAD